MAGTRRRTTTTQEDVPQAQAEDVRAALNDIDGPDEWLSEAYRLGMDRVRLHQRLPKSRAMPKRADLPKGTGGIEEIAEGECQKRNIPGGGVHIPAGPPWAGARPGLRAGPVTALGKSGGTARPPRPGSRSGGKGTARRGCCVS